MPGTSDIIVLIQYVACFGGTPVCMHLLSISYRSIWLRLPTRNSSVLVAFMHHIRSAEALAELQSS